MAFRRIYVVADIHGRSDLLDKVMDLADQDGYDAKQDHFVFLGDMIDRGPDSRGVIDLIKPMVEHGDASALYGNHEGLMVTRYVNPSFDSAYLWDINGGKATKASYGATTTMYGAEGHPGNVPEEIVRWVAGLPRSLVIDGFFFSHAPVPREKHRGGQRTLTGGMGVRGQPYNDWELTWHYISAFEETQHEKADPSDPSSYYSLPQKSMMEAHEGAMAFKREDGTVAEGLIGLCGHIHRGPFVREVRIFPKYRMLDCGSGCFPSGRLALHEAVSCRTMYADPDLSPEDAEKLDRALYKDLKVPFKPDK